MTVQIMFKRSLPEEYNELVAKVAETIPFASQCHWHPGIGFNDYGDGNDSYMEHGLHCYGFNCPLLEGRNLKDRILRWDTRKKWEDYAKELRDAIQDYEISKI